MIFKKYQIFLFYLFIKKLVKISLVFFCVVILINFFEEIRFSEKYEAEVYFVIYLSLINAPSLIFEILPFVFFVTIIFFYLDLTEKYEIEFLHTNGISNLRIVIQLSVFVAVLGIFILFF